MNGFEVDRMLFKIAEAIDKQYGCSECPYKDRCLASTNEQCLVRIKMWLESVIK